MGHQQLNFNVALDPGDDQPTLVSDNPPGGTTLQTRFEGVPGQPPNRWIALVPSHITGGATVTYAGGRKKFRVIVPPPDPPFGQQWEAGDPAGPCLPPEYHGDSEKVVLKYDAVSAELPDLAVDGEFVRSGGARWTVIEHSAFRLYEWWLRSGGQHGGGPAAIAPVCRQHQDLGFNTVRVWPCNISVCQMNPADWGDVFFTELDAFAGACAAFGLYVDWTATTQPGDLLPGASQQVAYLERFFDALKHRAGIISKVNEYDVYAASPLSAQAMALRKPAGAKFLLSNGSAGAGSYPPDPVLDCTEYHSNDLSEFQRKVGHNAMEEIAWKAKRPTWASENTRSDKDHYNLLHAYDAARNGALLCMGACCHTPEGKQASLLGGSLTWATRWAAGASSVRLDFQAGQYRRDDSRVGTNDGQGVIIRVHQRWLGGSVEESVVHA